MCGEEPLALLFDTAAQYGYIATTDQEPVGELERQPQQPTAQEAVDGGITLSEDRRVADRISPPDHCAAGTEKCIVSMHTRACSNCYTVLTVHM
jgi:hypothetical protein